MRENRRRSAIIRTRVDVSDAMKSTVITALNSTVILINICLLDNFLTSISPNHIEDMKLCRQDWSQYAGISCSYDKEASMYDILLMHAIDSLNIIILKQL